MSARLKKYSSRLGHLQKTRRFGNWQNWPDGLCDLLLQRRNLQAREQQTVDETEYRGITIRRADILRAVNEFDSGVRASYPVSRWVTYAVRYTGRLYPPKEILRIATQCTERNFVRGGGPSVNRCFQQLGFEIVTIPEHAANAAEAARNTALQTLAVWLYEAARSSGQREVFRHLIRQATTEAQEMYGLPEEGEDARAEGADEATTILGCFAAAWDEHERMFPDEPTGDSNSPSAG